jgi:hypothetical protein
MAKGGGEGLLVYFIEYKKGKFLLKKKYYEDFKES